MVPLNTVLGGVMKQISITIIVCMLCILSAVAYDTIFNLMRDNKQLQLEVDGYKLLLEQQEYKAVKEQIELRKRVRNFNELLTMCVNKDTITINRIQYRCYQVYHL